jgi:hypothetical protein
LIQDGTEQDANCVASNRDSCATSQAVYYFWIEEFPAEFQEQITNLVPNPGDVVGAQAGWASGQAQFLLCDYTQSLCVTGAQSSGGPDSSVEWIVERTSLCSVSTSNCSPQPLANFGSVTLLNCTYDLSNGTAAFIDQASATSYDMNDGNLLASTGAVDSNGTFSVTWKGYQ